MRTVSMLALLLLVLGPDCGEGETEIRVRNGSEVDFTRVIVGNHDYGDISSGAATAYQSWGRAYSYNFVSLVAGEDTLRIQPIDYVGENPLGDGKFTYVLTIVDGPRLNIRTEKD